MLLVQCPSCDHINPADAKLCDGCRLPLPGVSWHLAPCPRCGALNGVTATPCWACNADLEIRTLGIAHAPLTDRDDDAASPLGLASEIGKSSALPVGARSFRRQRFGLIIGSVVLAALAFSGYWAYRQQQSIVDSPRPAATPAAALYQDIGAADDAKGGNADKRVKLPGTATASSQLPPAATARAPENNESADRDVAKPPQAAASASTATVRRQKTANASVRTERQPPNLGPCTEAIAALALCTPEPARPER